MQATEQLKTEHNAIKLMLRVLDAVADRLERGDSVDAADVNAIVEFIRVFADRCHHGKEEDHLFPALERAGLPRDGGPVGVMLAEHDLGREFVRGLAEGASRLSDGSSEAAAQVVRNARGYADLLRQHIDKEDNILYEIADFHLDAREDARLVEEFERVERERVGPGRHEEFHQLLHDLRDRYLS
ncbi:MAG: hemerythrin [Anaerolineae bacterium]|nr:hemerythrin [Anaerolineae bacterium]